MITKLHNDKPINVPKIELKMDSKEIIIFIRYIDYISPMRKSKRLIIVE